MRTVDTLLLPLHLNDVRSFLLNDLEEAGVYIFHKYEFLVGWGKNMMIYWKNANIRGKM